MNILKYFLILYFYFKLQRLQLLMMKNSKQNLPGSISSECHTSDIFP